MNFDLLMLSFSLFTWGIGEGMFIYFQPIYLQQLGADTLTIAGVFSLFGLAMMITHIPAGYLADRFGRKPLLISAWSIGLLAAGVMAFARTLPLFVAGMLLYGFTAFVSSPLNSYLTAARGKFSPARVMTMISAAFNLGAVLGPVSGGWIGAHFGLRTIYMVAAGIFVISTALLLFIHRQPVETASPGTPTIPLWKNTRFVIFLGFVFFSMLVMFIPQPLTPRFLENERGIGLASIGVLGSIGSLGNSLLTFALGYLPARFGFLLAQISVAAFSLLLWKGTGFAWYAVGYFLLGGYRSARSLVDAQIQPLVQAVQMGLAYGMAETCAALAVTLAPILAGLLYTRQPVSVYWVALAAIIVSALIFFLFVPHEKMEAAPVMVTPVER